MSENNPPSPFPLNPIFNLSDWIIPNIALTINVANQLYLKRAGDSATGLINFNGGITVANTCTISCNVLLNAALGTDRQLTLSYLNLTNANDNASTTQIYSNIGNTYYDNNINSQSHIFLSNNSSGVQTTPLQINSQNMTIQTVSPPTCTAVQPVSTDSSTIMPTTAWVQSAIIGSTTPSLSAVLTSGNSAGLNSINMNSQNITAVNSLAFATTSQTTAYTGGAAGTYTNTNMTIDANGRITSISNGSLPPTGVKRAYAYVNNLSSQIAQFTINIPNSGTLTPRNQFVSFRLSFNQESYISGSVNQSFMTTNCILNLYPGRFVAGWLTQAGAQPTQFSRGIISDNTINASSATAQFVVNDATYCPFGRQFWANDLSYQVGGTTTIAGKLNISGGAGANQVVLTVVNPSGYNGTIISQNFNLSIELLNQSGSSGITTSGFALFGGVDF
jgi:hypothetical protein